MTHADVSTLDKEDLRATIAQVLDLDVAEVADDALFIDNLGVDSLLALEVAVVLEKKYGVKLVETELAQIVCLDKAYELLHRKLVEV